VISRGDRQEALFDDDQDRTVFLNVLGQRRFTDSMAVPQSFTTTATSLNTPLPRFAIAKNHHCRRSGALQVIYSKAGLPLT
jgi:hypothetical protein